MRTAKAGRLENALDEILAVLRQYGEVTISANVGGKAVHIRLEDADGEVATTGRRGGKSVVTAGKSAGNAPDADLVFETISAMPIGLTLEDLANKLDVRPRNLLKPVLQGLMKAGRVIKIGRRHRSASAVVRRGPPPKATRAGASPGRPPGRPAKKKAVSQAKLDALSKARAARAAKRAATLGGKAAKGAKPAARPVGRPPKATAPAKAAAKPAAAKPGPKGKPGRKPGASSAKLAALAKAREALAKARAAKAGKKPGKPASKPSKESKAAKGKNNGSRGAQRNNRSADGAGSDAAGSSLTGDKTPGVDAETSA